MKRTLIINGSPRINGDTVALLKELRKYLQGEIIEVSAFRSNIAPCIDCRGCSKTARCVVKDEMSILYDDDFDNVVLASPVYYATLPGQVLSLLSRFQPQHAATYFLNIPLDLKPKKAALILTAGGRGNEAGTKHHVRCLFRMLNAHGYEEHTVMSTRTDYIPAKDDEAALAGVRKLAEWLNDAQLDNVDRRTVPLSSPSVL